MAERPTESALVPRTSVRTSRKPKFQASEHGSSLLISGTEASVFTIARYVDAALNPCVSNPRRPISLAGLSATGVVGLELERVLAISETSSVFRPRYVHDKHTRRVLVASRALGGFVPNRHVNLNGNIHGLPGSGPATPRRLLAAHGVRTRSQAVSHTGCSYCPVEVWVLNVNGKILRTADSYATDIIRTAVSQASGQCKARAGEGSA
jgi:hypothetical protein